MPARTAPFYQCPIVAGNLNFLAMVAGNRQIFRSGIGSAGQIG
jgi:hypothetical protein